MSVFCYNKSAEDFIAVKIGRGFCHRNGGLAYAENKQPSAVRRKLFKHFQRRVIGIRLFNGIINNVKNVLSHFAAHSTV